MTEGTRADGSSGDSLGPGRLGIGADCIPCLLRLAEESFAMCAVDASRKERLIRRMLREISGADCGVMPVVVAQRMQRILREETGDADPYRRMKAEMNRIALDLLPSLAETVRRHHDPRGLALRLAAAGNLLDAGAKTRIAPAELPGRLAAVEGVNLHGDAGELFRAADAARSILYLADNAGEIVLDRLLVEHLPAGRVTVAVRGSPVINDATLEDAAVAGLPAVARVMANGSDAPGTLLDECAREFLDAFHGADLVLAKGQGNYETLSEAGREIFFLLTAKCPRIAARLGVPVGTPVLRRGGKPIAAGVASPPVIPGDIGHGR